MPFWNTTFLASDLSKQTAIFGIRLYIFIGICFGASIVLLLFLLSLCFLFRHRSRSLPPPSSHSSSRKPLKLYLRDFTPPISKEIIDIVRQRSANSAAAPPIAQIEVSFRKDDRDQIGLISDHQRSNPSEKSSRGTADRVAFVTKLLRPPDVSHLGWGYWYTLRQLETATGGFADENVIGEGGYGIVYRGVLGDGTIVAIKNLLNNRGQAEKEFRVEVEAIGRVRHKNLVRLLGYCIEGAYRILVYEYVDNGNLDHWLHGDVGDVSPLTWDSRMNIILETAKGLAYLHEGLEPKVVHRDVKSSNILLDKQWNSKVSDFGLAKILCSQKSYVTTRVMGTFGYVAPEYASTGMLNERSDVYSFGVLIMEIISGRTPVDYSRPAGEVNLVEWLKNMIGERRSEEVMDPKIFEKPSSKSLKKALLVSLRCVDPDALQRPKMGQVVHMLEMEGLLLHQDCKLGQEGYEKPFIPKK